MEVSLLLCVERPLSEMKKRGGVEELGRKREVKMNWMVVGPSVIDVDVRGKGRKKRKKRRSGEKIVKARLAMGV